MREAFIEKHHPADEVESSLVDEMAVANWRLHRIWAGEAAMFDRKIQALLPTLDPPPPPPDPEPATLFSQAFEQFAADENALKLMMRYEANCRWQYDRALRNLHALRKAAKELAPDGPRIGPGATVRIVYCPHKGGKCSDGDRQEECPLPRFQPHRTRHATNRTQSHKRTPRTHKRRTTNEGRRTIGSII
jgi:hypothetical protein